MNVAAVTLEYIVGVDSVAGHHEGAVLLRVAVEQEAVVRGGRLLGLKHGHVALGSQEEDGDTFGFIGQVCVTRTQGI